MQIVRNLPVAFFRLIKHAVRSASNYRPVEDADVTQLISGVRMNGHPYAQGDHVAFLPYVPRRGNQAGVGGRDGSSQSHEIGTIMSFYTVAMSQHKPVPALFVAVKVRPVKDRIRSLYVIDSIRRSTLKPGRGYECPEGDVLIHVDAITHKMAFVPHYDPEQADELMCAISMWEAR